MAQVLSRFFPVFCPIALTCFAGCHHAVAPPVTPASYEVSPVAAAAPEPAPRAEPTAVHVSTDILTACHITDAPEGKAPLFRFDSATLSRDDQRLLAEVAHCLTGGPLAGRALALVGRADPRGTEAYNERLGDRRATHVERYLEREGMAAGKVGETSRGALDATGHDESGWRMDRRVDVDLAM